MKKKVLKIILITLIAFLSIVVVSCSKKYSYEDTSFLKIEYGSHKQGFKLIKSIELPNEVTIKTYNEDSRYKFVEDTKVDIDANVYLYTVLKDKYAIKESSSSSTQYYFYTDGYRINLDKNSVLCTNYFIFEDVTIPYYVTDYMTTSQTQDNYGKIIYDELDIKDIIDFYRVYANSIIYDNTLNAYVVTIGEHQFSLKIGSVSSVTTTNTVTEYELLS